MGGKQCRATRVGATVAARCVHEQSKEAQPDNFFALQSLCTCLNWTSNLAVGLSFPGMLRALGIPGSYAVYAVRGRLLLGQGQSGGAGLDCTGTCCGRVASRTPV